MQLPTPRGPLSQQVCQVLSGHGSDRLSVTAALSGSMDGLLDDDDVQLALWMLFELHYRSFEGVDADLEWDPLLLRGRAELENALEGLLRDLTGDDVSGANAAGGPFVDRLVSLIEELDRGSLATFLQRQADREQFADFMRQRSIYHLKESDPQSFLLPRMGGPAKVALAELQYDEYGAGRPDRLHSQLFARAMQAMSLDGDYGAYIDDASATTLASNNIMSMFALRRRLRGAALGHLAAFEATSSSPCRRIVTGIERLGLPQETADYFDEHVEADAVHEQIALRNICAALVDAEPQLADDVLFGAAACLKMEAIAGAALIDSWHAASSPEPVDEKQIGVHQ